MVDVQLCANSRRFRGQPFRADVMALEKGYLHARDLFGSQPMLLRQLNRQIDGRVGVAATRMPRQSLSAAETS